MKRIIFVIVSLCCCLVMLTGCDKAESLTFENVSEYLDSVESYRATLDMTIYKSDKELKSIVMVDYKKPSYYKVCLKNEGGHEQLIVKNTSGVYIITPALNKEFKFSSDWPGDKLYGYLFDTLWSKIKSDKDLTYEINNSIVTIKAVCTDDRVSSIELIYDMKDNRPVKASLYDCDKKPLVILEFKTFMANKDISLDEFNTKKILDEYASLELNPMDSDLTISVSTNETLKSQKKTDDCTILCYGGEKNYTILARRVEAASYSYTNDEFTDFDYLEVGLLLYNNRVSKYFVNDFEVSIYTTDMSIAEVCLIAEEISFS